MQKPVIFVNKNNYLKDKKYRKVRDHCYYTGEYRDPTHSICNFKYSVPKKNPTVFQNGSNYDYHFIIKELGDEFEKLFTCLGENTEKYITFTIPIEKEVTRIDENGEVIIEHIPYILQSIDSARFMEISLSDLVNNFSEGILKIQCEFVHDEEIVKLVKLSKRITTVFLNIETLKMI